MTHTVSKTELSQAFLAASTGTDVKAISAIAPKIILEKDDKAAFDLITTPSENRKEWMPEALALCAAGSWSGKNPRKIIETIYNPTDELKASEVLKLYAMSKRIGMLGFSFPLWRFMSQSFGDDKKALVEHFGMTRLTRANDVRDSTLPFSNPNRDEFGTGFFWQSARTSIDYRRSYVACSIHHPRSPITLIIRNSSYFYGRDRLPEACYVSFDYKTPNQIKNFKLEDVTKKGSTFKPLQNILNTPAIPSTAARIMNLRAALDSLTALDDRLSEWLISNDDMPQMETAFYGIEEGTPSTGGRKHLTAFLTSQLEKAAQKNSEKPPLYLGYVRLYQPAWRLQDVKPLTSESMAAIQDTAPENYRFALLSGPNGDFPLGPQYSKSLANKTNQPTPKA